MVLDWEWEVFHFPTDLIFAHLALAAAEIFALAASLIVRFTGLATTGTESNRNNRSISNN